MSTLWETGKWVNELSSLLIVVVERASVSELALSSFNEVLAWHSLVVGVNCSKGMLTEGIG